MNTPSATPPGWLPDPAGQNDLRYWDGNRWTEHVEASPTPPPCHRCASTVVTHGSTICPACGGDRYETSPTILSAGSKQPGRRATWPWIAAATALVIAVSLTVLGGDGSNSDDGRTADDVESADCDAALESAKGSLSDVLDRIDNGSVTADELNASLMASDVEAMGTACALSSGFDALDELAMFALSQRDTRGPLGVVAIEAYVEGVCSSAAQTHLSSCPTRDSSGQAGGETSWAPTTPPTTPPPTQPPATVPRTTPLTQPPRVATTLSSCPTGAPRFEVGPMNWQQDGSWWEVHVVGSATNGTSADIQIGYVEVDLMVNGSIVDRMLVSPSGPGVLRPGQTVSLSGDKLFQGAQPPAGGALRLEWFWTGPGTYGCPAP